MAFFHQNIINAIKGYKGMLKKSLKPPVASAKIRKLGIKRMQLRGASEAKLYKIGLKIIDELEQYLTSIPEREKSINFYYGAEEFLQHLKKIFSEYTIENGKVVNTSHKSSCALVTFIQLIDKAKEKLTDEIALEIHKCSRIIAEFGSKEQKEIFSRIVTDDKTQPGHISFFFRQLQNLVSCVDELS